MSDIQPIPPGINNDTGLGYPGVDENGKLYWNIFFYWQEWTNDLRCWSKVETGHSNDCGIKISKRCSDPTTGPWTEFKHTIYRDRTKVRSIRVYFGEDVELTLYDGYRKWGSACDTASSSSTPIEIMWSEIEPLITKGETFIITGAGRGGTYYRSGCNTDKDEISLDLYYTTGYHTGLKNKEKERSQTKKLTGTILTQSEVSITDPVDRCQKTGETIFDWCWGNDAHMEDNVCKTNKEYINSNQDSFIACNKTKNLTTASCKKWCLENPPLCNEGLYEFCKDAKYNKETGEITGGNEDIAKMCGCFLPDDIVKDWKQPFLDAGLPDSMFSKSRDCFFPKCVSSNYKSSPSDTTCPNNVTCIANTTVGSVSDKAAIDIANECGIDNNSGGGGGGGGDPPRIEGAEGFFLQYNDDGKKRPTKKSWGIVVFLCLCCILIIRGVF